MKKITVNGVDVDYFHIQENLDGTTEVTFSKKFNVADAHISEIQRRLRENGLSCQVFKRLEHGIVVLWLSRIEDLHGVLHVLDVPMGSYEIDYDSLMVTVDVPKLERTLLFGDVGVRV